MRAFFALDIAPEIQHAIEKWRDRTMLPAGRAVPAANFHITLHFLGDIAPRQLERLCAEADQINASGFELRLDQPGYFLGTRIFWVGPDPGIFSGRGYSGSALTPVTSRRR